MSITVARDLALALGATRRAEGYLEGNGYRVSRRAWSQSRLGSCANATPPPQSPALEVE